ncbi:MAG: type II toxin-antitoxin system PemK/MazF family toxin [Deltaproteobacteria bacterium]|nr:type II toxin-antitoxin system PemK/MazF family toxin [Deltaproteobacteria bacterium]
MYSQRDIVLIPIPYTDLSSHKKRPVVIVSNNQYNSIFEDVVVVAITSNLEQVKFSIPIDNSSLEEGSLKVPSLIRPDKIYALNKNIIIKKFGKVSNKVFGQIKESIVKIID